MTDRLTIRRPDDWHVHLRDGPRLEAVAPYTARQFARAIVMPNLDPPVTTVAAAEAYRNRIFWALRAATASGAEISDLVRWRDIVAGALPASGFTPLMTCYL